MGDCGKGFLCVALFFSPFVVRAGGNRWTHVTDPTDHPHLSFHDDKKNKKINVENGPETACYTGYFPTRTKIVVGTTLPVEN